jgi:hypothetical protein
MGTPEKFMLIKSERVKTGAAWNAERLKNVSAVKNNTIII